MACRCCNTNGPCTTSDDCAIGYSCCDGTCRKSASNWAVSLPSTAAEGQLTTATVTHQDGCDSEEYYATVRFLTASAGDVSYTTVFLYTNQGVGTFRPLIVNDTDEEPAETFSVRIFRRDGTFLAESNVCTIAASDPTIWTVSSMFGDAVDEGGSFRMRVTTTPSRPGETFAWQVVPIAGPGGASARDFREAGSAYPLSSLPSGEPTLGAFGTYEWNLSTFADSTTDGLEYFRVQVLQDGVVLATSPLLRINDTSQTPGTAVVCRTASASGGAQVSTQYYTVSAAAGTIRVYFDVGNLADRFRFFDGNTDILLYDTGLLVGQGNFVFNKPLGLQLIRVLAEGQDANTRWCYTLMCVNDDTVPPACDPFA